MKSRVFYRGMWQIPYKQTGVLCTDGKYRTVHFTNGEPDTFFSIAGHVHAFGKTVTGFVVSDGSGNERTARFLADGWRKNAKVIKEATE